MCLARTIFTLITTFQLHNIGLLIILLPSIPLQLRRPSNDSVPPLQSGIPPPLLPTSSSSYLLIPSTRRLPPSSSRLSTLHIKTFLVSLITSPSFSISPNHCSHYYVGYDFSIPFLFIALSVHHFPFNYHSFSSYFHSLS